MPRVRGALRLTRVPHKAGVWGDLLEIPFSCAAPSVSGGVGEDSQGSPGAGSHLGQETFSGPVRWPVMVLSPLGGCKRTISHCVFMTEIVSVLKFLKNTFVSQSDPDSRSRNLCCECDSDCTPVGARPLPGAQGFVCARCHQCRPSWCFWNLSLSCPNGASQPSKRLRVTSIPV